MLRPSSRVPGPWLILFCAFCVIIYCFTLLPKASVPQVDWQKYVPVKLLEKLGTSSALPYPDVYLDPIKDDEWCEDHYGPPYLRFLADHHAPFCESGSKSSLECFRTNHERKDPFCVARGVSYDPTLIDGQKKFNMHCTLRNFTLERATSPEKAGHLAGIQDIYESKNYFYETGVQEQLKNFELSFGESPTCTATNNDNTYTLLVLREATDNIWHTLMELWQSMITIDALQMASIAPGKAWLPSSSVPSVRIVFEDDWPHPWDNVLWGMVTGNQPIRLSSLKSPECLGTVILPLPGSSSPFWDSHWEGRTCKNNFMLEPFLRRIYDYLGIVRQQRLTQETIVTIVDRQKTRRIIGLHEILPSVQARFPNVTIRAVDLAEISLREQIVMIRETDVLLGAIGAGLTYSMFLPKDSTVAEIFPPNFKYYGFRNMAKMRGLSYFSVHANKKEDWEKSKLAETVKPISGSNTTGGEEKAQNGATNAQGGEGKPADGQIKQVPNESEVTKEEKGSAKIKRYEWQEVDIYLTEDDLVKLLDVAITSQFQRGLRSTDVLGQA